MRTSLVIILFLVRATSCQKKKLEDDYAEINEVMEKLGIAEPDDHVDNHSGNVFSASLDDVAFGTDDQFANKANFPANFEDGKVSENNRRLFPANAITADEYSSTNFEGGAHSLYVNQESVEESFPGELRKNTFKDDSLQEMSRQHPISFRHYDRNEYAHYKDTPATTDNFCWVGNTRLSHNCDLIRCDFLLTYNSSLAPRGFACVRAGYTVDQVEHVYRNCVQTVSSAYDPCEAIIRGADNPRVNITSCEICWDNGCNIRGYLSLYRRSNNMKFNPQSSYHLRTLTSWAWFLVFLLWASVILCCLALCVRLMACRTCSKDTEPCACGIQDTSSASTVHPGGTPDACA